MRLSCPVCAGACALHDVVDLNRSCDERNGKYLPLSGVPIYYATCQACGFCFSPDLAVWTTADFKAKIYNDAYIDVDPDYVDARPRENAEALITMFADRIRSVRHLDYGGGTGLLSSVLEDAGWHSTSYDPFVDTSVRPEEIGQFDLITAFEVFEHVPDVQGLMSLLTSLLDPGGLILFTTVLSDGEILPGQRLSWWYAAPRNGHVSLYSGQSLRVLAGQFGLRLHSFSSNFHAFFTEVPGWAQHLAGLRPDPARADGS